MSPAKKTYLDMQYDSTSKLGLHWAAYIEVDAAYDWDPLTSVSGIEKNQILGIEYAARHGVKMRLQTQGLE